MKKRLLQVIAFVCVAVTLFPLCACVKQPDNSNDVVAENERAEHKVTNGLHKGVDNIPDTGIPFVVDGASEYKIVADNSDSHKNAIAKAAGFISSHINSATGVALEVVDGDTEIEWSISAKLVVVGSDKLQQAAGFRKTTDDIGLTGYQIQTIGNSVFVSANGDAGYNLAALHCCACLSATTAWTLTPTSTPRTARICPKWTSWNVPTSTTASTRRCTRWLRRERTLWVSIRVNHT